MAKAKEASEQNQEQQQNQPTGQVQGGQQSPQTSGQTQQSQQSTGMQQSHRGGQSRGMMARRAGTDLPGLFTMNPFQMMRMSPFQMMRAFTEEMDRMFDDFGGDFGNQSLQSQQGSQGSAQDGAMQRGGLFSGSSFLAPQIEVLEREGNLIVRADLPGLSPNDVQVELTNNGLLIQGERRSEHSENQGGFHHSEVSYGSFRRLVPLPEGVDAENAQANFNNGVLEITLKSPQKQQQNRRIEIQSANSGGQQQPQAENQAAQQTAQSGGDELSHAANQ